MTDREAWELAERLNEKAPEGVHYEPRRTNAPTVPQEAQRPLEWEPVTPWYVVRVRQ